MWQFYYFVFLNLNQFFVCMFLKKKIENAFSILTEKVIIPISFFCLFTRIIYEYCLENKKKYFLLI